MALPQPDFPAVPGSQKDTYPARAAIGREPHEFNDILHVERMTSMKKNNKGFTLAELLIVVAIIAVLVAIAIPVFTAQLEKSRDATSISNIRAAYAEAQASYLSEVGSDSNVTVNKENGKISTITVEKVHFAGVQEGWSDMLSGLPANATWSLTDAQGGVPGDYTLTFTYDANGVPTVTATK